jgi:3'(2'), 5'-bisphosphate nucleotidase
LEGITDLNPMLEISIEAAILAGKKTLEFFRQDFEVYSKEDNSPLTLADLESNRIINEFLETTGIPILSEENKLISFDDRKHWQRFWMVDPLDGTKEFIRKNPEYSVNIALIEKNTPILGVVYIPAKELIYYGDRNQGSYKALVQDFTSVKKIRNESIKLPIQNITREKPVILVSKSHLSEDTQLFIDQIQTLIGECTVESYGSSLKFCLIAEGKADLYPRIGSTMEWDTAASHAIVKYAGCGIIRLPDKLSLDYNKENLLNPSFIVYHKDFEVKLGSII